MQFVWCLMFIRASTSFPHAFLPYNVTVIMVIFNIMFYLMCSTFTFLLVTHSLAQYLLNHSGNSDAYNQAMQEAAWTCDHAHSVFSIIFFK